MTRSITIERRSADDSTEALCGCAGLVSLRGVLFVFDGVLRATLFCERMGTYGRLDLDRLCCCSVVVVVWVLGKEWRQWRRQWWQQWGGQGRVEMAVTVSDTPPAVKNGHLAVSCVNLDLRFSAVRYYVDVYFGENDRVWSHLSCSPSLLFLGCVIDRGGSIRN